MGALQRFVGGAAGSMAKRYGQIAEAQYEDKMAEVRERRLSTLKLETEETLAGRAEEREQEKFDLTQTREKEALTDPTSPTSLKRSQGLEDYEKKLQLQQQYKPPTRGGATRQSKLQTVQVPSGERDAEGNIVTDMEGKPLMTTMGVGPDGKLYPLTQFYGEGVGIPGGTTGGTGDPMLDLLQRNRGGGQAPADGVPAGDEEGWREGQFVGLSPNIEDDKKVKKVMEDLALVDQMIIDIQNEGRFIKPLQAKRWLAKLNKVQYVGNERDQTGLDMTRQFLQNIIEGK